MSRKIVFVLIILMGFGLQTAFAQIYLPEPVFHPERNANTAPLISARQNDMPMECVLWDFIPANIQEPVIFIPSFYLAAAASSDAEAVEIPQNIRNNRFYLESIRLTKLAKTSYDEGDYGASEEYAAEAVRYAQLSDEYVALQLKIKETNDSIATAKQRIDWVSSSGAAELFPAEFAEASGFYQVALDARRTEEWDIAIDAANNVINALAYIEGPDDNALPAFYTVRTWASVRDCLWNIAGQSWAYGDPFKWKLIYEANKDKMPEAGNPDLIHPGMVLDIPSARGEARKGMWDAGKKY